MTKKKEKEKDDWIASERTLDALYRLRQAVMLAIVSIDCERNGLTPDRNVRERLVRALENTAAAVSPDS
jgi:hypothetical protein